MQLSHLLYISDATAPMSQDDLDAIARTAQARNRDNNITGILMYGNGHFMQLIEGRVHDLNRLFTALNRDNRHHRIKMLTFCPIRARRFGDWDMNVINLASSPKLRRARLSQLVGRHAMQRLDEIDDFRQHTGELLDEFQAQLLDDGGADLNVAASGSHSSW